jgi:hypothetical protein
MDLADWFMWMGQIQFDDGTWIHAYKHVSTRRYFHLGEDGRAHVYISPSRYREITLTEAIDEAFDGWDTLRPAPDDPAAVRLALRNARAAAVT